MALIHCPECGREISSTAKSCVHCGYHFVVCPECGEIFPAETVQCPKCGYGFKEQSKISTVKNAERSQNEIGTDLQKIEQKTAADEKFSKQVNCANFIVFGISSLTFIIMVILFFVWKGFEPLEQILRYKTYHNAITAVLVLSILFEVLDGACDMLKDEIAVLRCTQWIVSEKINPFGYLKENFQKSNVSKNSKSQYERVLRSAYLAEQPKEKMYVIITTTVRSLLKLLGKIFFAVLGYKLLDAWMTNILSETSISLSILYWLIPIGICYVLRFVLMMIDTGYDDRYNKWDIILKEKIKNEEKNEA